MRAAICFRVNPSGKMILRTGFGGAVSRAVVSTSDEPPAPDPKPTTAHPIAASRPKPSTTPNSAASRPPRFRR